MEGIVVNVVIRRLMRAQNEQGREERTGEVASVVRALRILSSFDADGAHVGVSEIARRLGLHKSTTHRLLQTLEAEGFVRRVDGAKYALGWKLFELGTRVQALGGLQAVVLEELGRLVEQTGETAHLAILDGGAALYLEKVESLRPLRMPSAVGRRAPAHCTALGKVLLASRPEQDVARIVREHGLPPFTPATITDPGELARELSSVLAHGYAVDREEIEEGLMCIAAPIRDDAGEVCAAVSISGPASRLQGRIAEAAAIVQECAESMSRKLGRALHWLSSLPSEPEADHALGGTSE